MTHHGLKEGYYIIDGERGYMQRILGKWHYFIVLRGWKQLLGNERLEELKSCAAEVDSARR